MMNPMMGMGGMNPMQAYAQFRNMLSGGKGNAPHANHLPTEAFFEEVAYGRREIPESIKAVIMAVIKENTDTVMAQHGYYNEEAETHDMSAHRKFKETVEKLRDMPHTDGIRAVDEHFSNVTPPQRKVLVALMGERSKRKLAENAGMSLEDFMKHKHELEKQLK